MSEEHSIDKLTLSTNFALWKFKVRNIIQGKSLLTVLDKTYVIPTDKKGEQDIAVYDARCKAILCSALDDHHLGSVIHCTSANNMWEVLISMREGSSATSKFQLRCDLNNYKFKEGQPVSEYLSGLNILQAKLKTAGVNVADEEVIAKILSDLPKQFDLFKQNYHMTSSQTEELNLTKFTTLLLEVDHNLVGFKKSHSGDAFVASRKSVTCFNCGKKGHMNRDCKVKKSSINSGPSQGVTCFKCGKAGHIKKDCRYKDKFVKQDKKLASAHVGSNYDGDEEWIADGGCTFHMTSNRQIFETYDTLEDPISISIADGSKIQAIGVGIVKCMAFEGEEWIETTLHDVHHVPQLGRTNLFSVGRSTDRGNSVKQTSSKIEFFNQEGERILVGERSPGHLWELQLRSIPPARAYSAKADMTVWHKRLGHTSKSKLQKIQKDHAVAGMDVKDDLDSLKCTDCPVGRMTRLPCKEGAVTEGNPGEHLSSDLCGPMLTESLGGARYFLLIKDRVTCYREVYFLKTKDSDEVVTRIDGHIRMIRTQTGNKVKTLRTDNGREFVNQEMEKLLSRMGITHEKTVPYTPEENGSVERDNRTIVEMARTMLHAASLPPSLWAEMVNTAVYLHNRVPNRKETTSPFELMTGKKPRVDHLRVIGSVTFTVIPKSQRTKWEKVSWTGRLVGYGNSTRFYRIFDPKNKQVFVCKDVKVIEAEPMQSKVTICDPLETEEFVIHEKKNVGRPKGCLNKPKGPPVSHSMIRRSHSVKESLPQTQKEMAEEGPYKTDKQEEKEFTALLAKDDSDEDPMSYREAIQSKEVEKWKKAMAEEMSSLEENQTWTLVDPPKGRKVIRNKWVFKVKRDRDGNERYKARLVAKGYTQREGIDFQETYSPVVKYETLRILLSVAAFRKLVLTQFDVKTAFLYGTITEELYMEQPEGFNDGTERVCKLRKGLYGLKQSPRAWNDTINELLIECGMYRIKSDNCVYVDSTKTLFLSLYVDDGLIFSATQEEANSIISQMRDKIELTVSDARQYIGLEIDQEDEAITIRQEKYVEKILKEFEMTDCKPVKTPSTAESKTSGETTNAPFKEAVGALMFLSNVSRPDISFATGKVARAASKPTNSDWMNVKRILRYLRGTTDIRISYPRSGSLELRAFSDADYAGDENTRKSTTGSVLTINDSPVSWSSKLQKTVSLSTTEAEYNALAETTKEVLWTRSLLEELGVRQEKSTTIYNDNQSTLKLVNNDDACRRTKHMAVKVHFVRDEVKQETINTMFIPTTEQKADFLTKALPRESYEKNRSSLRMTSKKTALFLCLMVMSNHLTKSHAMFDQHPPIVWKKSKDVVINGAELIRIKLHLASPCEAFNKLTHTKHHQVSDLIEWCEKYYEVNIMQKLEKHQKVHVRSKRDLAYTLMSATLGSVLSGAALPVTVVVVVGIVIIGVVAYVNTQSRIDHLQATTDDLRKAIETLNENEHRIQAKLYAMSKEIDSLITKHNLLSRDVEALNQELTKMIILTSEISSKLAVAGHQLDNSYNMWKEGRVDPMLFRALEVEVPCKERCPTKLMTAVSWRQHGNDLEIVILAPTVDMDKEVIEAHPFVLYDGSSCELHYTGDMKLTIDKRKEKCNLLKTKTVQGDLVATGEQRCLNDTTSPWNRQECGRTAPEPQVKSLGMDIIVYCRGHMIVIDSLPEKKCPDYAFSLSVKQSFKTGNYIFKPGVTDIKLQQRFPILSQQEVNSKLLPGINPYLVEKQDAEDFTLKDVPSSVRQALSENPNKVTIGGILLLLGIAFGLYKWRKSHTNKPVIRQVP